MRPVPPPAPARVRQRTHNRRRAGAFLITTRYASYCCDRVGFAELVAHAAEELPSPFGGRRELIAGDDEMADGLFVGDAYARAVGLGAQHGGQGDGCLVRGVSDHLGQCGRQVGQGRGHGGGEMEGAGCAAGVQVAAGDLSGPVPLPPLPGPWSSPRHAGEPHIRPRRRTGLPAGSGRLAQ